METLFQITKHFEKDLKKFSSGDQKIIEKKINYFAQIFQENPSAFYSLTHKLNQLVTLSSGLNSSLYALKIGREIRLIATFDNDPIFDQIIITLLACVRHNNYQKALRGIAESLYQRTLVGLGKEDENHGAE